MSIAGNIALIRETLPKDVELLCVSKYHTLAEIQEAYNAGERAFGESRVQELVVKYEALPKDICWHFIGHLQTNKIRALLPCVTLIHGVDSWRLLEEINKEAAKLNLPSVRVLLEAKVAEEETKYGFTPDDLTPQCVLDYTQRLPHIQICGIMGMASFTDNVAQIKREFAALQTLHNSLTPILQEVYPTLTPILSMGMSEDYPIAIEHGATLIRIGSGIFGERL